jgi:hypothetical protein
MKTSRFKASYRDSASKFHRHVGDVLRTSSIFSGFRIFQEYPVSRVLSSYPNNRHKFDWVILDLSLVIEIHGQGHYNFVNWGGGCPEESLEKFRNGLLRDEKKEQAAVDAGYTYIVIPYWDIDDGLVDENYVWDLYLRCRNPKPVVRRVDPQKERLREHRREQYQAAKKWRESNGS